MFEIISTYISYVCNAICCCTKVQRRPGRSVPAVLNTKIDDYDAWRETKRLESIARGHLPNI